MCRMLLVCSFSRSGIRILLLQCWSYCSKVCRYFLLLDMCMILLAFLIRRSLKGTFRLVFVLLQEFHLRKHQVRDYKTT
jgi:hypothetical protein